MTPTISDIARMTGLSKSTVSRALNDSPLISAETKERVRKVADEQGFEPNAAAQQLSLQRSNVIALLTPPYKSDTGMPDAFMLELMGGITDGLVSNGYDLLVARVHPDDKDWVRRYYDSGRVDGFIATAATCKPGLLKKLAETGAPLIVWGASHESATHCSVLGDNLTGGRLATAHLVERGRRRIGFLGGPAHDPQVRDRLRGYEAALAEADIPIDPELVMHVAWGGPGADPTESIATLLDHEVDAIFANSDLLAAAALADLRGRGLRVPEDVAIVGYDDSNVARSTSPPLTSVSQNGPLAGRILATTLIEHLKTGVVITATLPAELVVREST
jgi:DNA-binding LacI/PurR family transcriptional regulator